jgi:hypothetical protein
MGDELAHPLGGVEAKDAGVGSKTTGGAHLEGVLDVLARPIPYLDLDGAVGRERGLEVDLRIGVEVRDKVDEIDGHFGGYEGRGLAIGGGFDGGEPRGGGMTTISPTWQSSLRDASRWAGCGGGGSINPRAGENVPWNSMRIPGRWSVDAVA